MHVLRLPFVDAGRVAAVGEVATLAAVKDK
jgi:hypothetical protein